MDVTFNTKQARRAASAPQMETGMAMALLLVVAAIHLIEVPDNLQEATYKGLLFLCGAEMAFTAAVGIYHGSKVWGWGLGFLVTGGAFTLYIVSRTIGLPGLPVDPNWLEPIGVLSLLVEGTYIGLFTLMQLRRRLGIAESD
jgi:hypothetical protein